MFCPSPITCPLPLEGKTGNHPTPDPSLLRFFSTLLLFWLINTEGEIFLTDNLLLAPKLGYLCLIGTFHGATCSGDVCFSCRRTTFNFCRLNAEGGPSSDCNVGTASSDDVTPLSPAPDFGSDSGERNPNQGSR